MRRGLKVDRLAPGVDVGPMSYSAEIMAIHDALPAPIRRLLTEHSFSIEGYRGVAHMLLAGTQADALYGEMVKKAAYGAVARQEDSERHGMAAGREMIEHLRALHRSWKPGRARPVERAAAPPVPMVINTAPHGRRSGP